ncbi:MAG TPA: hypothetical protein VHY91_18470 [Pirellulales bacterium]|jgi:hypothetical protein|nr:hypothetical protein [Pirellulales bacterium]
MTESRLPHRQVIVFAERHNADRRAIENAAQLRRVAQAEPRAVLGVVAFWLGSAFSEGADRVHA